MVLDVTTWRTVDAEQANKIINILASTDYQVQHDRYLVSVHNPNMYLQV